MEQVRERKSELESEGVKSELKIIRRLLPFETEKPLAEKVYAFLLKNRFKSCLEKAKENSDEPLSKKARDTVITKNAKACHKTVTASQVRTGANFIAAMLGHTRYVRLTVAQQVMREAKPYDVLLKKHDFEYEYKELPTDILV